MSDQLAQSTLRDHILSKSVCIIFGEEETVNCIHLTHSNLLERVFAERIQLICTVQTLKRALIKQSNGDGCDNLCIIVLAKSTAMVPGLDDLLFNSVVQNHFTITMCFKESYASNDVGNAHVMQYCIEPSYNSLRDAVLDFTDAHLSCFEMMKDELMDEKEYQRELLAAVDEELGLLLDAHQLGDLILADTNNSERCRNDLTYLINVWKSAHTMKTTAHMISATKLEAITASLCDLLRGYLHGEKDMTNLSIRQVSIQVAEYLAAATILRALLKHAAKILEVS